MWSSAMTLVSIGPWFTVQNILINKRYYTCIITICCKLSPKQWRAMKSKLFQSYHRACFGFISVINFHKLSSKLPCLSVTWLCRESLKSVTEVLPRNACSHWSYCCTKRFSSMASAYLLQGSELEWRHIFMYNLSIRWSTTVKNEEQSRMERSLQCKLM